MVDQLGWLIPVIVIGSIVLVLGISAAIFIPLIVRLVRNSQTQSKVLQTGVDATATIVTTWDTGVRINDNPQVGMRLQVQPAYGAPFQADVTKTVSIVQLAQFQPGAQLQVKYDPSNPQAVAIVSVISGYAAPAAQVAAAAAGPAMNPQQVEQMLLQYQAANEAILKTGMSATAKVLQYMPMGINVNGNNPVVNLMLEICPVSRPAFTSWAQGVPISESSVPKYQPGQMITVRYNPNDLTRVAVEHSGV